ncbi:hypothetical protein S83_069774 [Arachis hypogaea]
MPLSPSLQPVTSPPSNPSQHLRPALTRRSCPTPPSPFSSPVALPVSANLSMPTVILLLFLFLSTWTLTLPPPSSLSSVPASLVFIYESAVGSGRKHLVASPMISVPDGLSSSTMNSRILPICLCHEIRISCVDQCVPTELKKVVMQARMDKKLTQAQLAQIINKKPQVIQEYESGKAIPNQQIIGKLERALGAKLRGKK